MIQSKKNCEKQKIQKNACCCCAVSQLVEKYFTGFPRSWKIIENPGKINFPGKSWKSHGKLIKI